VIKIKQRTANRIKASIIVCTYSKELFPDTIECIRSLSSQDYPNKEILLVMDENEELYRMYKEALPASVALIINPTPGLSPARNCGIQHATGDIIVFIDDDATAGPDYLANLIRNYEDGKVIGTAGKILPRHTPSYPEELYWVGGFTYKGFPEERCEVRNAHGCNMSFRREVFERAGLFDVSLGRVGRKLVTAEETEFSIRALGAFPGSRIMYDPEAVVHHKVHEYRERFWYLVKRGYYEGMSKAHIEKMYKGVNGGALKTEDTYLKFLLGRAVPGRLKNICMMRDVMVNAKEAVALMAVIGSVGVGYGVGRVK